jgi:hypothetical protein
LKKAHAEKFLRLSFLTYVARMCIALLEHHCGKHFPGIASALINKALALMQQGHDIDAIASLKKAQRIHESICGKPAAT